MKKSFGILLAACACVAAPHLVQAQMGFSIAGGPSFASGNSTPSGTSYGTGYGVQGSLDLALPLLPVGFRIDGLYNNFALNGNGSSNSSTSITGARADLVLGVAGLPLIGPYLLGGVGYYHVNTTLNGTSASSDKPGASLGAGVRVGIGGLAAFAEADYHYVYSSGSTGFKFAPVMVGVSFR